MLGVLWLKAGCTLAFRGSPWSPGTERPSGSFEALRKKRLFPPPWLLDPYAL